MTQPNPVVRPGQIWADNDPRSAGRHLLVLEVGETHAEVELTSARAAGHAQAKPGRRSRIRLNRFRATSTGYRLISEPAVAERIRSYPEPDRTVWHRPAPGHACDGQCDWHPIACSTEEGIVAPGPITSVPALLDGRPAQSWCPDCVPAEASR